MTYSEMRSAYQMSERLGKDCYIGSSHTFTPQSFVEVLKQFGKAGSREAAQQRPHHAHHEHRHHQQEQQLPPGARGLSKPLNDRSAIRTESLKHGAYPAHAGTNGGQSGYGSPPVDQSTYDRRFQSHAPAPPHHPQQHQQQQQQQQGPKSSLPPHVAADAGSGARSTSPAPSQASDLSQRSKDKKRLKNPFSFKK
jgi:syntaxin-binding protein 1